MSRYTAAVCTTSTPAPSQETQAMAVAHVVIQIDLPRVRSQLVDVDELAGGGFVHTPLSGSVTSDDGAVGEGLVAVAAVDDQDPLPDALTGERDIADVWVCGTARPLRASDHAASHHSHPHESASPAANDDAADHRTVAWYNLDAIHDVVVDGLLRYSATSLAILAFLQCAVEMIGTQLATLCVRAGIVRPATYASEIAMAALFCYSLVVLFTEGKSGAFKFFAALIGAAVFGYSTKELVRARES